MKKTIKAGGGNEARYNYGIIMTHCVFFLTTRCGSCDVPAVFSEKKKKHDPLDKKKKNLLDPKQVTVICPRFFLSFAS